MDRECVFENMPAKCVKVVNFGWSDGNFQQKKKEKKKGTACNI